MPLDAHSLCSRRNSISGKKVGAADVPRDLCNVRTELEVDVSVLGEIDGQQGQYLRFSGDGKASICDVEDLKFAKL